MANLSKKPNRLVHEKSPYLLQHAHNPVDWFPWGNEAFEKAEKEDKIILLSIGYSTCHWCHVMERESFEDVSTAELLNRDFVCIKLDREERPDIDKIYMDALHAMGTQGGWPLNMFLTPKREPILGGTYFPPENRYGKKSFKEVLRLVSEAWKHQKEELLQAASELTIYLNDNERKTDPTTIPNSLTIKENFKRYVEVYDKEFFGFKTNSINKFPPSMALSFLLDYYLIEKDNRALEMAFNTAYAMKSGGIYDQIGGGICRYSTDHEWLVPHFEKMLYDNALFVETLANLYQITGESFFLDTLDEIITYVERDMRLAPGGIASAEDADSEGEEGKFYLWKETEILSHISDSEVLGFWNVTEEGNFENKNILHVYWQGKNPFQDGIQWKPGFKERLQKAKVTLLNVRNKRIRPLRDDKVLTSWNALWMRALLKSYDATENITYLEQTKRIYQFLLQHLIKEDGTVLRRYRDGEAKNLGTLPDYAEFVWVSLRLFQETGEASYYKTASLLFETIQKKFSSNMGPYFEASDENVDLIVRTIEGYDGVEPSGNSTMLHIIYFLHTLGYSKYSLEKKANEIFSYFFPEMSKNSLSYPSMISALQKFQSASKEVIVVYRNQSEETIQRIYKNLRKILIPGFVWLVLEETVAQSLEEELEILKERNAGNGIRYYVCQNFRCELPTETWEETFALIQK
ncbi:thioredoxin domain-containing protein [Leptospira yanagawae]|uniref:Thioredoxin domain-containing protein n=1 Tax=Leptospira yanagawae TaxID=293069 RepID=A0ABY2LZT3_9LEPT|nr:thioredoxin domain-containing protein [Leptospira yanagawae]TGL18732.1 thioredoxin domain-containing protein [Leptospira yanagawae]